MMENGIQLFNGFVLVAFEGKFVKSSTVIPYEYSLPLGALACELADECKDYE
jgi:hypothetical protein